jgi:TetR/AcrR family transcriptional regulator
VRTGAIPTARVSYPAAAQHEFAAKGLGCPRRLPWRARANKRMIYHYFGNKAGLYLAALERVYEDLRGTERTLDLAHLAPEAAIRARTAS